jgi:DNA-binding CsgD family transcriptional regulator
VLLGFAENRLGDRSASERLREAIRLARVAGERHDLVLVLAIAISEFADHAAAWATFDECMSIAGELGDEWLLGVALDSAGYLDVVEENWSAGRQHMQQALAIFRRLGDEGSIAIISHNLGVVAREQGEYERAAEFFEQSVALNRRLGVTDALTLCHLGDLALRQDDTARATTALAAGMRSASRDGAPRAILVSLCRLARLASAVKQHEMAARFLGAAEALRDRSSVTPIMQRELDSAANVARCALGEADFRATTAMGAGLPLARVTAEALAWVDSLVSSCGKNAADHQARNAGPAVLSPREMEVLRLIAGGSSNRKIADKLVISLNTVARHISNIFDKIGAANRTEAAAYAHRHGIAAEDP